MMPLEQESLPPEPGLEPDLDHGLSDAEAGHPSVDPPEDDQTVGDEEELDGDGEDLEDDDDA